MWARRHPGGLTAGHHLLAALLRCPILPTMLIAVAATALRVAFTA